MKIKLFFLFMIVIGQGFVECQIGIGTSHPDSSAILEVAASQKGILLPSVSLDSINDKNSVPEPVQGFIIYNNVNQNDVSKGFYFFNGNSWRKMLSSQELKEEILTNPIMIPIFVASNLVSGTPSSYNSGTITQMTFNQLEHNSPPGATGNYDGYTVPKDGSYSMTFTADIRNTTGDTAGDQVVYVRSNGNNICVYGIQRVFQFGGISGDCSDLLTAGDHITFWIQSTGSSYQVYNTNVSIHQDYN